MLIKTTIKKEETIEREVSLPYFCKYDNPLTSPQYFKVTEEKVVDVTFGFGNYNSISCYQHGVNDAKIAAGEEITEQEFNEAYHKALFEIGKYVPVPETPKQLLNQ